MWSGTSGAQHGVMLQLTDYTTARVLSDDHAHTLRQAGRPLFRRAPRSTDQRRSRHP